MVYYAIYWEWCFLDLSVLFLAHVWNDNKKSLNPILFIIAFVSLLLYFDADKFSIKLF